MESSEVLAFVTKSSVKVNVYSEVSGMGQNSNLAQLIIASASPRSLRPTSQQTQFD
jgi:hypothetical protein